MQTEPPSPRRLRRELSLWEAIGISVALMAPSMAANINPQGTAGTVGRAVPLAFFLATLGVLLIAWTFVRLCQRYNHAGSVYGFVGATLGPRAGVVSGWSLIGTYTFYGVVTSSACGIFLASFLDSLGVWTDQPSWAPFVVTAVVLLGVFALTVTPVRAATRLLLTVEGVTVLLILVVAVVVLARLVSGTAPGGHAFTLDVFTVAPGTDASVVFLGVVFGFLSFAGFEAAATLGEEARNPRRNIPRAILGTAIFGGVYFVFVTAVEVMGFGADDTGIAAFVASPSLMGDLGTQYLAAWVGDVITLGAAVSAFACSLACAVGGSRLLYALGRDGVGPAVLGRVSARSGAPVGASLAVVAGMYVIVAVYIAAFGAGPQDSFLWSGSIGTLILLAVYVIATIGAMRLLFFSPSAGGPRTRGWEIVIPVLGLVVLGYTLYRNVWPIQDGAARWFPVVTAVWIVLGLLYVLARPAMSRRVGERLTAEEGLAPQPRATAP
ncbi:APC family permease [Pseudonocardia endophytica]|uniref:Amino acid/polyamine/organocation transporter (APC superfamily) n=1 Tax=Pseudonocardia endophytica TaxID=401976 RepID=A0A4R1HGQ4_PSEEN|nr:APC family permease [Pseudonocardia endophytica]TCK19943.1 amino acid/polyamine/organocation transporter (APC superfamily) [Pseudonocardia endophytica]